MVQDTKAVPTKADDSAEKGKKPYQPPVLKRLGTVRELTLSGGGSVHDSVINPNARKHM